MWTFKDEKGSLVLGFDGKDYVGSKAGAFILWGSLLNDEVLVSPVGPVVKWPYDDLTGFYAAQVYLRESRMEDLTAVPPSGYAPDRDDVVH